MIFLKRKLGIRVGGKFDKWKVKLQFLDQLVEYKVSDMNHFVLLTLLSQQVIVIVVLDQLNGPSEVLQKNLTISVVNQTISVLNIAQIGIKLVESSIKDLIALLLHLRILDEPLNF